MSSPSLTSSAVQPAKRGQHPVTALDRLPLGTGPSQDGERIAQRPIRDGAIDDLEPDWTAAIDGATD